MIGLRPTLSENRPQNGAMSVKTNADVEIMAVMRTSSRPTERPSGGMIAKTKACPTAVANKPINNSNSGLLASLSVPASEYAADDSVIEAL